MDSRTKVQMNKNEVQSVQCRAIGSALIALLVMGTAGVSVAAGGTAASAPAPTGPASASTKKAAPATPVKLVDINSASRKELMTLPGIGAAEADKIIANRPYLTKTELVSKAGLPVGPYVSLKNLVMAKPKGPPPKPKP